MASGWDSGDKPQRGPGMVNGQSPLKLKAFVHFYAKKKYACTFLLLNWSILLSGHRRNEDLDLTILTDRRTYLQIKCRVLVDVLLGFCCVRYLCICVFCDCCMWASTRPYFG